MIALCIALGSLLFWAILELPELRVHLAEQVTAKLAISGVTHPVTAVLLNFRGYDTMLEVAVLFVALVAMLAQTETRNELHITAEHRSSIPSHLQVLQWLARVVVPLMILFAGYLLWAGAHRAGGAFQAAAVLAAAGVLLKLADMLPVRTKLGPASRWGLLGGLLLFFIVAAAVMPAAQGNLLQYPYGWAGALILLIEAGLTLSLGLILARMFLLLADDSHSSDGEE